MRALILACSSLLPYIDAAQKKVGTFYPVRIIDRRYHDEPEEMRRQIIKALKWLPPEVDTVLAAMGFCGGSWENIPVKVRVVIPRVDDCVTLLLHTDDQWQPDRKEPGHLYLRDTEMAEHSPEAMQKNLCVKYGGVQGEMIFRAMFADYTNVDIIDTGIYDCYSEEYAIEAQKNADLIGCVLDYVAGSNRLLEKLVAGVHDRQFFVIEPGQTLSEGDFFPDGCKKKGSY